MKPLSHYFSSSAIVKTYSTPGGIKPDRFKSHSLRSRIMPMPLPPELWLPLRQRDGKELTPLVKVGDQVLKYQLLAQPVTQYGVPLYAPTSGRITDIRLMLTASTFEESQLHLILAPDNKDTALSLETDTDYEALNPALLTQKLQKNGVSGLGGADFPTSVKLNLAQQTSIDLLIINAVECEPFISVDEALIRERAEQVLTGAKILLKASNAARCVIAIEDHKKEAIESLTKAMSSSNFEQMTLAIVKTKYPAGSEKQLVQAITGKEVPTNGLPADLGVLVQNTGTAYSAYNAIVCGKPCISRITTLAGSPLKTPKNFEVLLGTPIPFLLDLCGIDHLEHTSTIIGGSLMGETLFRDEVAVTRACNCIIATSQEWFPEPEQELACIRCGFCADACPVKLLPQQLYAYSRSLDLLSLEEHSLNDCIECGACSYVCPSNIPLVQYFRSSKSTLQQQHLQQSQSTAWQERYQYHQYRIKKEKEEAHSRKNRLKEKRSGSSESPGFSRDKAKAEIAAAVNRVKQRKQTVAHPDKSPAGKSKR